MATRAKPELSRRTRAEWIRRGACVEVDTAVFYDERLADQARRVCARCPVKRQCLEFALATNALGVWAGTTEQYRQRLRGRRGGLPG